jgi:hypothetical protein
MMYFSLTLSDRVSGPNDIIFDLNHVRTKLWKKVLFLIHAGYFVLAS